MEFRILGPLEVVQQGGIVPLQGARRRALLALLVVHVGRVVPTDQMAELLWEGTPPESAPALLRSYVSKLRRLLGGPEAPLVARPPGYVLDVPPATVDAARFECAVGQVRRRPEADPAEASAMLNEALRLWRGAPLREFAGLAWADAEAARLEGIRLDALEMRIEADLTLGCHHAVVPELEALVEDHPLRERLWGQLMLALYRCDRQAEALRACRRMRTLLREELGIDPSPEVTRLEEAILNQSPELDCAGCVRPATRRGVVTVMVADLDSATGLGADRLRDRFEAAVGAGRGTLAGDAAIFTLATDAIAAAADLASTTNVATALHTGEAGDDGDGYANLVAEAERLRQQAGPGETVVSPSTAALAADRLPPGLGIADRGDRLVLGRSGGDDVRVTGAVNLPVQVTTFVGRDAELARTAAALDEARVVTLTGVAGVGKTRLALEATARFGSRYQDGAWLVELTTVTDPNAVPDVVAAALKVGRRQGESIRQSLAGYLRRRRLLLVLDNCEHLVEGCAPLVEEVVRSCPDVRVLATSQRPLGVAGEWLLRVPPLDVPPPWADEQAVADAASVRLFADRARAVRSEFEVTDANRDAVARLCRRLDGIPLALELAAARVRAMTPAEIAERLDHRFRLLRTTRSSGMGRHQTLRQAVDWSYSLLSDPERALLRRVSVFAGGFALDAAEAVAAGHGVPRDQLLDLLAGLVDRSLVVAEDDVGTTRFSLLETIRQYAAERLADAGERERTRRRHAEHYASVAEIAGEGLSGPEEATWARRFDRDLDNLRAAVAFAIETGDAQLAAQLAAGPRAHPGTAVFVEATGWAERVIDVPGVADEPLYPAVLTCAAWGSVLRGDLERGAALASAAIDAERRLDAPPEPLARRVLGLAATAQGRTGEAREWAEDALAAARTSDDQAALAFSLAALALAATQADDPEGAVPYAEESVRLARRMANPTAVSYALTAYGYALSASAPAEAVRLLTEAATSAEAVGSRTMRGMALSLLGRTHARAGEVKIAFDDLLDAIDDVYRLGWRLLLSASMARLATALTAVGHVEAAAELLGASEARPSPYLADAVDQELLRSAAATATETLGSERFARLRAAGASLSDEELVARARAMVSAALADGARVTVTP